MKISIITAAYNSAATIADTLKSVASQQYKSIEHIVIDGNSTDGTQDIVESFAHVAKFVSEPDQGIYDAMNKGIQAASGDVIGMLNADDIYQHEQVISRVAELHQPKELDACYADLVYVKQDNMDKVVRNWTSQSHTPGLCFKGWMPAHPTLFLKRSVYEKCGLFDTDLKYQADLEFCARIFEVYGIQSIYTPELWVRMRMGGTTNNSIANMIKGNWESYQALKKHGLKRNPISYFTNKFAIRIPQFFRANNER